ncbi:MAG: fimbrillin family protein, partial [Muribaculaceae bacterium]|nr:fimbrillin family protein [Muribaculaceae bacterium]
YNIIIALLTLGTSSCSDEPLQSGMNEDKGKPKIDLSFSYPSDTRATETSFEKNDIVGVFVNESYRPLEIAGNTVNNEKFQFNGQSWSSSKPLYWDAGTFNVYGYYPYSDTINSITDFDFEVKTDQRDKDSADMSGYEASDFLYASAKGVTASSNPISMQFRHILSKITVRLIKGEDYEGDLPETALVYVHNTVTKATIDLEVGVATKYNHGEKKTIIARQASPTSYSAILIPQRLDNRMPLIEVIMEGISFLYESKFQFKPGMHHIINLVIDNNPDQIKIEIGGEITNWN